MTFVVEKYHYGNLKNYANLENNSSEAPTSLYSTFVKTNFTSYN